MAVEINAEIAGDAQEFVVLRVCATCQDGKALPEKRISVSAAALAEGTTTIGEQVRRAREDGQRRIRNFEAARAALQELT